MADVSNVIFYVHEQHKNVLLSLVEDDENFVDLSQGNAFGGFWEDSSWGMIDTQSELTELKIPFIYWTGEGSAGAWDSYTTVYDGENSHDLTDCIDVPARIVTLDELVPAIIEHNKAQSMYEWLTKGWGIKSFYPDDQEGDDEVYNKL